MTSNAVAKPKPKAKPSRSASPAVIEADAPSPLEALRPLPVAQVAQAMAEYQGGLQAIVDDSDWQEFSSRDGTDHRFLKRSGWRKIALWFGLDVQIVREIIERDDHDMPTRAKVIARAVAPNGRAAEDIGACSIRERRFSKPEHDIIATAATRAINRAVSNLVGLGEISAEEIDEQQPVAAGDVEPPPWGRSASADRIDLLRAGLVDLGLDDEHVNGLVQSWAAAYGVIPNVLVNTVSGVLRALQHQHDQQATPADVAATATQTYPPEDTRTAAEKLADNDVDIRQQMAAQQRGTTPKEG
jgi:hypothetical protein